MYGLITMQQKILLSHDDRIGIWGYGISGRSFLNYLTLAGYRHLSVYDDNDIPEATVALLSKDGIPVYTREQKKAFISAADRIAISPGVIYQGAVQPEMLISEIQLFQTVWTGHLIGITGTIGKTTITQSLTHLLKHSGHNAYACGNIGIPLLSITNQTDTNAYAVAELSSFQLNLGLTNALRLAIFTNFYPNHLDHHSSIADYFQAKCRLLQSQIDAYTVLAPAQLIQNITEIIPHRPPYLWWSTERPPLDVRQAMAAHNDRWYYYAQNRVWCEDKQRQYALETLPIIPGSYQENALITYSALHALNKKIPTQAWSTIQLPEHRCAKIRTVSDITFYNDSKATIPEATIAAIAPHGKEQLVLFWGGLSKGVDRSRITMHLAQRTRLMVCFGAEADQLSSWCQQAGGSAIRCATLEEAIRDYWHNHAQAGDSVLFSPGGSSYDLFKNFEERGRSFCNLVDALRPRDYHS